MDETIAIISVSLMRCYLKKRAVSMDFLLCTEIQIQIKGLLLDSMSHVIKSE